MERDQSERLVLPKVQRILQKRMAEPAPPETCIIHVWLDGKFDKRVALCQPDEPMQQTDSNACAGRTLWEITEQKELLHKSKQWWTKKQAPLKMKRSLACLQLMEQLSPEERSRVFAQ